MTVATSDKSSIYGVLLAAGQSRRFGETNKLLAEIDGVPLVRRVAERLLGSRLANVVVVTGFESERVEEALSSLQVQFVDNPDFESGLASSLRQGIDGVSDEASGAMIALGDMPGLTTALVDQLIDAFEGEESDKIVLPTLDGRQRNPVIWPKRYFAPLLSLEGDSGAKGLISANMDVVLSVPVEDDAVFRDIDEPADLAKWDGGAGAANLEGVVQRNPGTQTGG